MAKIVIDPGHGGSDSGAVYEGRREKDDVLRLGIEVGKMLQKNGQDVFYTRVSDVYNTPLEKASMGNKVNADIFLSLHRNTTNIPNTTSGVEASVYEASGIREEMAQELLKELEELGFINRGILERPNLTILRRTDMPAIILEIGFIDNEKDNILFDKKFEQIVRAIATGVLNVLKRHEPFEKKPEIEKPKQTPEERKLYRVQVGAFRNYQNAARFLNRLESEGYPAFMLFEDGIYRVQVGAYELLDNAIRMEQQLRSKGYNTFITTN